MNIITRATCCSTFILICPLEGQRQKYTSEDNRSVGGDSAVISTWTWHVACAMWHIILQPMSASQIYGFLFSALARADNSRMFTNNKQRITTTKKQKQYEVTPTKAKAAFLLNAHTHNLISSCVCGCMQPSHFMYVFDCPAGSQA